MKIDKECWDCLNLNGEGETKETFKYTCLKNLSFDKTTTPCHGYEWDEVNDKPWYNTEPVRYMHPMSLCDFEISDGVKTWKPTEEKKDETKEEKSASRKA